LTHTVHVICYISVSAELRGVPFGVNPRCCGSTYWKH